jgi:probable rRNA maturation factor
LPAEIELPIRFLGDVIICPSIVKEESIAQKKPFDDHLAHIVIHGILHLLGYDHIKEQDAKIMEPLEIKLLSTLDIANPYEEIDHD